MTSNIAAAQVALRRFPAPYRAMLAISNDIDLTSIHRLRNVFRFVNTREDTPMGPGLGMDFANSMWMYKAPTEIPGFGRRFAHEIAYFADRSGNTVSPYADELVAYAKAGWIDTLHSYGNFTRASKTGETFERRHAERAINEMARRGIAPTIWTNHGDVDNRQNLGDAPHMQGADPSSPAYHADLIAAAGMKFIHWQKRQAFIGHSNILEPLTFADGQHMHGFPRFTTLLDNESALAQVLSAGGKGGRLKQDRPYAQVWAPMHLNHQVGAPVLDKLVEDGLFAVIGQHLGDQAPLPGFDANAITALKRLAYYQDRGLILIAATGRLLAYAANRASAKWRVASQNDGIVIDIETVANADSTTRPATRDDVDGFSFEAPVGARIAVAGRLLDTAEIERRPADVGEIISVRWPKHNAQDMTADFRQAQNYRAFAGFDVDASDETALATMSQKALAWMKAARDERFKDADKREAYAFDYSEERYSIGLPRYGDIMGQLGFTGRRKGLDIGSGAGHWVLAFAHLNGGAVGIEQRADFVEIANGAAKAVGYDDTAQSMVADARDLPFEDGAFDTVWSHGVIMFVEHDLAFQEMNRVSEPSAALYIGYTSLGHRLRVIESALTGAAPPARLGAMVHTLFSNSLYRAGIFHTPGNRVCCYSREALQQTAQFSGFVINAAPGIQDEAGLWRGHETTIDFLAKKMATPDERADRLLKGATDDAAIFSLINDATRFGAPEAALRLLDRAGLDPANADVRRYRTAALLKAGHLQAAQAMGDGLADGLLRAKLALDAGAWEAARTVLSGCEDTPGRRLLDIANLLFTDAANDAVAAADRAVEAWPDDLALWMARLRALDVAGETERLKAATADCLDRAAQTLKLEF